MEPGRELDAKVSRALGNPWQVGEPLCPEVPPYSTDIAAAFLVVEKMRVDGFMFDCGTRSEGSRLSDEFFARFWDVEIEDGDVTASFVPSASLPHAICLAALNARGGE